MKRKFLTNLLLLITVNLLVKPFWVLGIDLTVQNRVGAEDYGFYFSLLSFSLLLNIIQDLGITNYNNREVSRNHNLIISALPNLIILKLFLTLIYFVTSLTIALLIGYDWIQIQLLVILLFNLFLNSMNLYFRSNISGLQLFRTESLLSVTDRLLMIVICSLLLWGNITKEPFRIEWYVYAQTAAYFLTTLIILATLSRYTSMPKIRFNLALTKKMFKQSYGYALLGFLMIVYYRTDSVMLERMLPDGQTQAGIYAQGFRILDSASMIGFMFAGILLPMFSKMIKQNEPVIQLFKFSFLLLLIPAMSGALGMNLYSTQIMELLYRSHADEASKIFEVLMISFIFISISIITGTLLTANGNIRELNIIAAITVIMNLVLNLILIPQYKALGSAISSTVSQFIVATCQLGLTMIIFKQRIPKFLIVKILFLIVILVAASVLFEHLNLNWVYGIIIIFIGGPLIALTTGIIKISEIKESLF